MAEYPRPESFGDDWDEYLNCAVGRFRQWLVTEWQELDAYVGKHGFHPRADVGDKRDAVFRGLPHFVEYVLAWCYEHQKAGRPAFTGDQERDLIQRVDSILDGIVHELGENIRNDCESKKTVWRAEIPRRFDHGRRKLRTVQPGLPDDLAAARPEPQGLVPATLPHSREVCFRKAESEYRRAVHGAMDAVHQDIWGRGFGQLSTSPHLPKVFDAHLLVIERMIECDKSIAQRRLTRIRESDEPEDSPFDARLATQLADEIDKRIWELPDLLREFCPALMPVDHSNRLTALAEAARANIIAEYQAMDTEYRADVRSILNRVGVGREPGKDIAGATQPSPIADESVQRPLSDTFVFTSSGDGYFISAFRQSGHVKRLKGFEYIERLVSSPHVALAMVDLVGANDDRLTEYFDSHQETMDPEYRRQVREKLHDLNDGIETSKSLNDQSEVIRLQNEKEEFQRILMQGLGIRGRSRSLNNPIDKLRSRIHRNLQTAYETLRAADPPMNEIADHFQSSISSSGSDFVYQPVPKCEWSTGQESRP